MNSFYYFELFAIILLYLTSYYEFQFIYSFTNSFMPNNRLVNNIDIVEKSIKIILKEKFGELIVFLYPISFVLVGILTFIYLKLHGVSNTLFVYDYIIVCIIVISLHIFIPYFFNYLKFAEESLKKEFGISEWINISMSSLNRESTLVKEYVFDLNMLTVIDNNIFHKNNYDKYLEAVNVLKDKMCSTYNNITYEEYIRIIPFLTGFNFFIKEGQDLKELIISEDKYEINNITFGLKPIYYSLFKYNDLNTTFLTRYLEVTMFFLIINVLLVLSNQL